LNLWFITSKRLGFSKEVVHVVSQCYNIILRVTNKAVVKEAGVKGVYGFIEDNP